jgi:hypothetical protein
MRRIISDLRKRFILISPLFIIGFGFLVSQITSGLSGPWAWVPLVEPPSPELGVVTFGGRGQYLAVIGARVQTASRGSDRMVARGYVCDDQSVV